MSNISSELERKLKSSVSSEIESFRKSVLEGIEAASMLVNMEEKTVVDYNEQAEKLIPCLSDSAHDTSVFPRLYEEVGGSYLSLYESADIINGNEERILEIKSGKFIPVRIFTIEVWIDNKRHKAIILFDITRERMLERRLWHMQHLETMGDIAFDMTEQISIPSVDAKGVIQQALGIIDGCLEGNCGIAELGKLADKLKRTAEDIDSLEDIVSAFRSVSKRDGVSTLKTDINMVIKNCLLLTKPKWDSYADVELSLAEVSEMGCSSDELGQMFLNLLMNASYSVRKKFEGDNRRCKIKISTRKTSQFFEIKIADSGIGIKKEDYRKIFNPDFSSREIGRSKGLAVTYEIVVKRYGGTIEFKSSEGEGAEFVIRIP